MARCVHVGLNPGSRRCPGAAALRTPSPPALPAPQPQGAPDFLTPTAEPAPRRVPSPQSQLPEASAGSRAAEAVRRTGPAGAATSAGSGPPPGWEQVPGPSRAAAADPAPSFDPGAAQCDVPRVSERPDLDRRERREVSGTRERAAPVASSSAGRSPEEQAEQQRPRATRPDPSSTAPGPEQSG